MYELLPESYVDRQLRGIFDLVGQLLRSVFGVATDQQIEALRSTAVAGERQYENKGIAREISYMLWPHQKVSPSLLGFVLTYSLSLFVQL